MHHVMKQRIVITGVTGLVGKALAKACADEGYDVAGLTRRVVGSAGSVIDGIRMRSWDGRSSGSWEEEVDGAYAVINLAGESIAGGRWTRRRKEKISGSRLDAIHAVQRAVDAAVHKPRLFIQASAVGYFGTRTSGLMTETDAGGSGFLAGVCRDVEAAALKCEGTRVVITRLGMVLDMREGALNKMLTPVRLLGMGITPVPSGHHVSWIDPIDLTRAILHILASETPHAVYHLTSSQPVKFKDLMKKAIAKNKTWIRLSVPWFLLKAIFGNELVKELLQADQQVFPKALLDDGFQFRCPDIETALDQIFT
jgi:uncharacterized protein